MTGRFPHLALLLGLCLAAATVAADDGSPGGRIDDRVDLHIMTLTAYAYDEDDDFVSGLALEDFSVEVDGDPLPVSFVDEFRASQKSVTPTPEELEAGIEPEVTIEVPRYIAIFVDSASLDRWSMKRAMKALRALVLELDASDQVMLVEHRRGLEIIRPYSTSREQLLGGLSEIEDGGPLGTSRQMNRRSTARNIQRERLPVRRDSYARMWAKQEATEVRNLFDSLERALRDLSGQPGRRGLLLVSNGFEMNPGQEMFELAAGSLVPRSASTDESATVVVSNAVQFANKNDITIFSIDGAGLDGFDSYGAGAERSPYTEGLRVLADETGGRAVVGRNDLEEGVSRVRHELNNYYQIGVRLPEGAEIGKYRRVKIDYVGDQEKVRIRARRGYAGRSYDENRGLEIESSMVTGRPLDGLEVRLGSTPGRHRWMFRELQLWIEVPIDDLTWTDGPEESTADLVLYIEVVDEEGRRSELASVDWTPSWPTDSPPPGFRYETTIKVRQGPQRILAAVRDRGTELVGSDEIRLVVE